MADIMSKEKRSALMARIKAKDTKPERRIGRALRAAGKRPRKHDANLPGRPDFVFPRGKVAVFVDGDFWHGWRFPVWEHKLQPFWREKISKNRERDQRNFRRLRASGWKVIRIWEHEIEKDLERCIGRIIHAVEESTALSTRK
jgi:DNA mismatch endonuclease (patch repair protein)